MKRYILTFIILSFILLGFKPKPIYAYDSGCIGSTLYSITTGQPCNVLQYGYSDYSYGCTSDGPYNIITGQLCGGSQYYSNQNINTYPYTYPNPYPYNYPYYNQPPVISGINGPRSLNVNQMGAWTVTASNMYAGNLTYSVNWGDQPVYAYGISNLSFSLPQQNATFTHTYTRAGTYNPVFTVTNSSGQSANTSLSVVVGGGYASSVPPFISSISVSSGRVGTQVTIYGKDFISTNICNTYPCVSSNYFLNTINFGLSIIPNVHSSNGTSLTFTIPAYTNSNCLYSTPACVIPQYQIIPGTYPIFVTNQNGTSNVYNFTVTN